MPEDGAEFFFELQYAGGKKIGDGFFHVTQPLDVGNEAGGFYAKDKIFGMQTGVGMESNSYPMEYAQDFSKKPVIGAGLVLNNGTFPLVKLMDL